MAAADVIPRFLYADHGRSLIVRPRQNEDTDALFERVCADFADTKVEQDAQGNVHIIAPTGGESSDQNSELTMQLRLWAKRDGRGRAFDSHVLFILPDHSRLSPDGAWVAKETSAALSEEERRKFLPIVPEFVVELMSPSDRLPDLQNKMQSWIRNGVELAWLIYPEKRCVFVYRKANAAVDTVCESSISGEEQMRGFVLDLEPIWQGLRFDLA